MPTTAQPSAQHIIHQENSSKRIERGEAKNERSLTRDARKGLAFTSNEIANVTWQKDRSALFTYLSSLQPIVTYLAMEETRGREWRKQCHF